MSRDPILERRMRREARLLWFLLPAVVCASLFGIYQFLTTGDARWLLLCACLLIFVGK